MRVLLYLLTGWVTLSVSPASASAKRSIVSHKAERSGLGVG